MDMHTLPGHVAGMTRVSAALANKPVLTYLEPVPPAPPACSICRGARYTRRDVPCGDPAFGKAIPCVCQKSEQQKRTREGTYTWLGASEEEAQTLAGMTFETFQPSYQSVAYHEARGFARQARINLTEQPNMLLVGSNGTGKTHLAAAILNELRFTYLTCLFTTVPRLFSSLYAVSFERRSQLLGRAAQAHILCLDDLDKLHVRGDAESTYQKESLFELLNQRDLARKPTLITTNAQDGLQPWLDKSTLSRLFGNLRGIKMDGQDYRQLKRKKEAG